MVDDDGARLIHEYPLREAARAYLEGLAIVAVFTALGFALLGLIILSERLAISWLVLVFGIFAGLGVALLIRQVLRRIQGTGSGDGESPSTVDNANGYTPGLAEYMVLVLITGLFLVLGLGIMGGGFSRFIHFP